MVRILAFILHVRETIPFFAGSGRFDRGGGDGPAEFGFQYPQSRREGSGPAGMTESV